MVTEDMNVFIGVCEGLGSARGPLQDYHLLPVKRDLSLTRGSPLRLVWLVGELRDAPALNYKLVPAVPAF